MNIKNQYKSHVMVKLTLGGIQFRQRSIRQFACDHQEEVRNNVPLFVSHHEIPYDRNLDQ